MRKKSEKMFKGDCLVLSVSEDGQEDALKLLNQIEKNISLDML